MVYGALTSPLRRTFPFEMALAAFVIFTVFLFWLVKVKERVVSWWDESAGQGSKVKSQMPDTI